MTKSLIALGAFSFASANASTVVANAGNPAGGVGYTYNATLGAGDITAPFIGTVGSWSWEDSRLGDGVGWRHQADWIAVTLTESARLIINFSRADVDQTKLFPSFTLYRHHNDVDTSLHFFANSSNVQFPGSVEMVYLDHVSNSTLSSIEEDFVLPAGNYTIAFGGNAISEATAVNQNYSATLQAVAIPEPSSLLLTGLVGFALLVRRRA